MKRYALFAWERWEPAGGWEDYKESFNTVEEAKERALSYKDNFWHIVDLKTSTIVVDEETPREKRPQVSPDQEEPVTAIDVNEMDFAVVSRLWAAQVLDRLQTLNRESQIECLACQYEDIKLLVDGHCMSIARTLGEHFAELVRMKIEG